MSDSVKVTVKDGVYKSACRMCHGVCGALIHVRGGKVEKVTGDPDCPTSKGYICSKGRASVELLYHPDRLKHPLRRTGERGENKWERIIWQEALDTIAAKYKEYKEAYGGRSMSVATGTGRPYMLLTALLKKVSGIKYMVSHGHICYHPRIVESWFTCGQIPVCDYYGLGGKKPECVVMWGCNIDDAGAADGMSGHHVALAKNRGARIIVIDPRRSRAAVNADLWLRVRPGTDGALAMGMINVIINEELYDKEFVENWTVGFNELKEAVKDFTPEKTAEITWVPEEQIVRAARMYASTKPAAVQWGVGLDQHINSVQSGRAVLILMGITGNIDVPGGNVLWVPPAGIKQQSVFLPSPVIGSQMFAEKGMWMTKAKATKAKYEFPFANDINPVTFWRGINNGSIDMKMMLIMGANLLLTHTHIPEMVEALKKIDFIAAVDLFMNPTIAQFADLVLPSASWLETDDICNLHKIIYVLSRRKVAEVGEARDDRDIVISLAHKMGLGEHFPWENYSRYLEYILEGSGITMDQFREKGFLQGEMRYRKYLTEGFKTPTGKFEIYSEAMKNMGLDPLPGHIEPPESPYSSPDLYREYPLVITTGARRREFFHSEGRQIASLRRAAPYPRLQLNPETAKKLGFGQDDWVIVESRYGKARMKAEIFEGIHPGVVSADHAWWFPEKEPPEYGCWESNINMLISGSEFNSEVGSVPMRSFLCRVYKEQESEARSQKPGV